MGPSQLRAGVACTTTPPRRPLGNEHRTQAGAGGSRANPLISSQGPPAPISCAVLRKRKIKEGQAGVSDFTVQT